jgi:hypothetical protein
MIKLQTNQESPEFGPGRWHLHTAVTTDEEFVSGMRKFIFEALCSYPKKFTMKDWMNLKERIITAARKLAAPIGPRNKEFKLRIASLQGLLNNTDWSIPAQRNLYWDQLHELRRLNSIQDIDTQLIQQSHPLHDEYGAGTTNTLPSSAKTNFIKELNTNGDDTTVKDIPSILREIESFYGELYSIKQPCASLEI